MVTSILSILVSRIKYDENIIPNRQPRTFTDVFQQQLYRTKKNMIVSGIAGVILIWPFNYHTTIIIHTLYI